MKLDLGNYLRNKEKQIFSFMGELVGGKMSLKWVFSLVPN